MAAHRYWRLNIIRNNGGNFSGDQLVLIPEIEMRIVAAGADQCTGGTALGTAGYGGASEDPAKAFDNSSATWWQAKMGVSSTTFTAVQIGYDFGSGVTKDIIEISLTANSGFLTRTPTLFEVQYSDDNSNWFTSWTVICGTWASATARVFTRPTGDNIAAWWGIINPETDTPLNNLSARELDFFSSGSNITSGGTGFMSPDTGGQVVALAFDNNTSTFSATIHLNGTWIGYHFASDVNVDRFDWNTRVSAFQAQGPVTGNVYWSDDGVNFIFDWAFNNTTAYTSGETRTFSKNTPDITSLSPTSGDIAGGTAVTITGVGFTSATGVTFGGSAATSVVVVSDTSITCVTPAHAVGAVNVVVLVASGNITEVNGFTYTTTVPTLTNVSPNNGGAVGGTAVTLTGTLFTGTTDVKFGGTSATSIVVVGPTSITCVTPAHAVGAVTVQVFNPGGNPSLASAFTYTDVQIRITQTPLLLLDKSNQKVHITQSPMLVVYQEKQPTRVTQTPLHVLYTPKPVPLPGPVIPEVPLLESWNWLTSLTAAFQSQEQRGRLREVPRYKLQMSVVILNEADRVKIYNMLMRFLKTVFTYPLFQYNAQLTAAAVIGGTKLFCDTSKTDVRAGEFVALFDPRLETVTYLTAGTIDSDGINLSIPLTIDIPVSWQVCPAFNFRVVPSVGLNMRNIAGDLSLVMESTNPRVFQRPGAAPTLTTIDGILIVPERPIINVPETFNFGAEWFDNGTSVPDLIKEWTNPHTSGSRRYKFERRAKIDYWRAVCDTLKGRQGVALFPTFRNDLPLRDAMVLNANTFTTNNINFFIWWLDRNYRYLAIATANGMKYRAVISVDPHYDLNGDPDYITVKLASSTGNTAGDNVISSISYMNLHRLDTDEVKLTHSEMDTVIDFTIKAVNE